MTTVKLKNALLRPFRSDSNHPAIDSRLVFTILLLLGSILIPFMYRAYQTEHAVALLLLFLVIVVPIFFYAVLVAAEGYNDEKTGGWAGALEAILGSCLLAGILYSIFAGIRFLAVKVLL